MSNSIFRIATRFHVWVFAALLCLGPTGCGKSSSSSGDTEPDEPAPHRAESPQDPLEADPAEREPVTATATLAFVAVPLDGPDHAENPRDLEPLILTEVNALRSETVLVGLTASDEVQATAWFQKHGGDRRAALNDLQDNVLTAAHIRATSLIRISATTLEADDALTLLRVWAAVYLREVEGRAQSRYNQDRIAFQIQYEDVVEQLDFVEARISRHLLEHPLSDMDARHVAALQELMLLNAKKSEVEELLASAEASYALMLQRQEPGYTPTEDELMVSNLPVAIQQLDAQLRQLQVTRQAQIDSGKGESHPVVQNIDSQIRNIEQERAQEFDHFARALFAAKLEQAAMAVAIYQEQSETFEPRIAEISARLDGLEGAVGEYHTLLKEQQALERQRDVALSKLRELDVLIRRAGPYTVELHTPPAILEP